MLYLWGINIKSNIIMRADAPKYVLIEDGNIADLNHNEMHVLTTIGWIYKCEECGKDHYHINTDKVKIQEVFDWIETHHHVNKALNEMFDPNGKGTITEEQSAEVKQWILNTLISHHDGTAMIIGDLQGLLPNEYAEGMDLIAERDGYSDTDKIVNGLMSDIEAYREDINTLLKLAIDQNPEQKEYWLAWVNGEDMKRF